jgi:hypothetical protein
MLKILTTLAVVLLASAPVATSATKPHTVRSCRTTKHDDRWKAVFGHFSKQAPAQAMALQLRSKGFTQAQVQNWGCSDFAVTLLGLDTQRTRDEFSAEAKSAGYPGVTYQASSTETLTLPKGTWRAVFGTFPTPDAASAAQQKAAEHGFRISDVEYAGPRKWKLTVFAVPAASSREFAREARAAGLAVTFEIT